MFTWKVSLSPLIFFEAVEVRAFGLLLRDMATYLIPNNEARWAPAVAYLQDVATSCADTTPTDRPSFSAVTRALRALQKKADEDDTTTTDIMVPELGKEFAMRPILKSI